MISSSSAQKTDEMACVPVVYNIRDELKRVVGVDYDSLPQFDLRLLNENDDEETASWDIAQLPSNSNAPALTRCTVLGNECLTIRLRFRDNSFVDWLLKQEYKKRVIPQIKNTPCFLVLIQHSGYDTFVSTNWIRNRSDRHAAKDIIQKQHDKFSNHCGGSLRLCPTCPFYAEERDTKHFVCQV